MQSRYQYVLTQRELQYESGNENRFIQALAKNSFLEKSYNHAPAAGLAELRKDLGAARHLALNHRQFSSITEEELAREFPGQHQLLLRHYSQYPAFYASSNPLLSFLSVCGDIQFPSEAFSRDVADKMHQEVGIFAENGEIYFKAVGLIPLNLFLADKSNRESRSIEATFKLTQQGFELVRIATNQKPFYELLKGNKKAVLDLAQPQAAKISGWQRFKQKWNALSTARKVAAGIFIALGIAAVIVGVFFCPPLSIALPFVGKIGVPAILTYGGAGLAGATALGHTADIATTRLPKEQASVAPEPTVATPHRPFVSTHASTRLDLENTDPGSSLSRTRLSSSVENKSDLDVAHKSKSVTPTAEPDHVAATSSPRNGQNKIS